MKLLRVAISLTVTATLLAGGEAGAARRCFPPSKDTHFGRRGPMRGDVDGDGQREEVYTYGKRKGGNCTYGIVVLGRNDYRIRIRPDAEGSPSRRDLREFLQVEQLGRVDDVAGNEIAVTLYAGASTIFVRLFTVHEGRLQQITTSDQREEFPAFGSVGHRSGLGCVGDHDLTASDATYKSRGDKYEVVRRHYDASDTLLVLADTQRVTVAADRLERRYKEFEGVLAYCGARARPRP